MQMLLAAGREGVNIRDQLDAEASLRDARNALTRTLVDYTIAPVGVLQCDRRTGD